MWQNNGFGNNDHTRDNVNSQERYPSYPVTSSPLQQNSIQLQPNQLMSGMHFDDSDETMSGFEPEVGLSNEAASHLQTQAQLLPSVGRLQQFSPAQFNFPTSTTPILNTRDAELKAQLLKGRRSTSQPPNIMAIKQENAAAERSRSLRASPQAPVTVPEKEKDITELISEFSKPIDGTKIPIITKDPGPKSASNVHTNGIGKLLEKKSMNLGSRYSSNRSLSETSEGEIFDEIAPAVKAARSTKPQSTKTLSTFPTTTTSTSSVKLDIDGAVPRGPQEDKPSYTPDQRESHSRRESRTDLKADTRRRDDRHDGQREEVDAQPERRNTFRSDYTEQKPSVAEKPRREIREVREPIEETHRSHKEETTKPVRELAKPTLAQILPHDENLREWLEITGYHNEEYRNKILERRRKLAKLDAEKAQLLAEMAREERGVPAGAITATAASAPAPAPVAAMPPPQAPANSAPKPEDSRSRVVPKRTYSDFVKREESASKLLRTEDRGRRLNDQDDDADVRQRRYDSFKTERPYPSREISPDQKAYESRPPARSSRDSDDVFGDYESKDLRQFEVHGAYKGRAFDPNYRGRGRGIIRGRGDYQSRDDFDREYHSRGDLDRGDFGRGDLGRSWRGDSHMDQSRPEGTFGSRIANSKPYKDFKGFSRGGRGETRYFIVKSFNEENVMNCIEDSVWTTQVQNGEIFKDAFETCKNVILVFSINKSKAFQGYARMESLPGSISPPQWQNAINWESTGAFKVRWLVVCSTRFHRVGHLKNALNESQAVLIGKDGQEIEENCGAALIELIDEEYNQARRLWRENGGAFDKYWEN